MLYSWHFVDASRVNAIWLWRRWSKGGVLIARVTIFEVIGAIGSARRVNGYDLKVMTGLWKCRVMWTRFYEGLGFALRAEGNRGLCWVLEEKERQRGWKRVSRVKEKKENDCHELLLSTTTMAKLISGLQNLSYVVGLIVTHIWSLTRESFLLCLHPKYVMWAYILQIDCYVACLSTQLKW